MTLGPKSWVNIELKFFFSCRHEQTICCVDFVFPSVIQWTGKAVFVSPRAQFIVKQPVIGLPLPRGRKHYFEEPNSLLSIHGTVLRGSKTGIRWFSSGARDKNLCERNKSSSGQPFRCE